jgi:hypothetical protein
MQLGTACNVQVEVVSLLGKVFLNEKYGLSIPIERGGCDAIASKAFVRANGSLFPCQEVAKTVASTSRKEESVTRAILRGSPNATLRSQGVSLTPRPMLGMRHASPAQRWERCVFLALSRAFAVNNTSSKHAFRHLLSLGERGSHSRKAFERQ